MTFPTAAEAHHAMEDAHAEWMNLARAEARRLAQSGPVTVDDVRKVCPPPETADPRIMGAIFRTKEWVATGYRKSTRNTCHKRPIAVFELSREG